MVIFSEFYVLMFFSLMPVFVTAWDLISTPPGELSAALSQIHAPTPVILGMLVVFRFFPTMKAELRGVHQLSVSAVARGAQAPGARGSYAATGIRAKDLAWLGIWAAATALFLGMGGPA